MVRDTDDPETVRIALRIRSCDNELCDQKAVTLEGAGVDCPTCYGGSLRYATGDVQTVEVQKNRLDMVADSEIVDRSDE